MRQFNTSKLASFSRFSKWEKEMATGLKDFDIIIAIYFYENRGNIFFFRILFFHGFFSSISLTPLYPRIFFLSFGCYSADFLL